MISNNFIIVSYKKLLLYEFITLLLSLLLFVPIQTASAVKVTENPAISWSTPLELAFVAMLIVVGIIGIVLSASKYRKRKNFSKSHKKNVFYVIQKGKCAKCKRAMKSGTENYHHKDGNRCNNKISNCQALHPHCHDVITYKEQRSYRNRTNISSLKWPFISVIILLLMLFAFINH
jgi:uncharacterized integral membrane protein